MAFATATVWPARTASLAGAGRVRTRRAQQEPLGLREELALSVCPPHRLGVVRAFVPFQVECQGGGVEDGSTDVREAPADEDHPAVERQGVLAAQVSMEQRPGRTRQRRREISCVVAKAEGPQCGQVVRHRAFHVALRLDDRGGALTTSGVSGVHVLDEDPWTERGVRGRKTARVHPRHPVGLAGEEREELRFDGLAARQPLEDRARRSGRAVEPKALPLDAVRRGQDFDRDGFDAGADTAGDEVGERIALRQIGQSASSMARLESASAMPFCSRGT